MIGKIRKGSRFKGCVNYVLGKEQAALLHAEGILAESNRDIIGAIGIKSSCVAAASLAAAHLVFPVPEK